MEETRDRSENRLTMKFLLIISSLVSVSTLSANVIFSIEAATVQQTTIPGARTEDFNSLIPGQLGTYYSSIGLYSTGAAIVAPDLFGGANSTNYISVGQESGALSYSLTFYSPQAFFGLDWTGGDGSNKLQFYNGSTLVGTFTTFDIQAALPPNFVDYIPYFGNPNDGSDPLEPFFYVNFFSNDPSTNFTSVVFSNFDTTTGFESDNQSIVPEPSALGLLGAGLGAISLIRRRQRN